jgi:NAD(P)-dependent dehydrogenase (short-subunit alcohol dehydrogenase family)
VSCFVLYCHRAIPSRIAYYPDACFPFVPFCSAYKGHQDLLSYTSTKAAQVGLLRSLSKLYKGRLCRVNGIAPGPILTPLIPATWGSEKTTKFGAENPFGRAGQPIECATAAVFLASSDSSYVDGQVLHVDGGMTTSS